MTTLSAALDDTRIRDALRPYGGTPSTELCVSIRTYVDLLLRWNQRVSLTTVTDPLEILRFHIGESIAAISLAKIERGRLADVGSGAGFPGIPLALFASELDVTLIESNTKKATFLAEAQRALGLRNVCIFRGRFGSLEKPSAGFDFVTTRALGSYPNLLTWSSHALVNQGYVVLWVGLDDAQQISRNSEWNWQSPARIPATNNRVLLVGQSL